MTNIAVIEQDILATRDSFNARLSTKQIHFEAEAGFAVQQIEGNDYLAKVAMNNRQSVANAINNVAAIGISLNPARKQAYLVPRDNKVCLDISYIGLVDLATQSGSIAWAKAELVFEQDEFELGAPGCAPRHKFNPFAKDRGDCIGAYVVAKTSAGDFLTDAMSIDEINAIRDRSAAWKAFKAKGVKCPWNTDPGEMCKKTVVKRAAKMWPKNDRLNMAIHYLNEEGEEGLADAGVNRSGGAGRASAALDERRAAKRKELLAKLEKVASDEGLDSLNAKIELLNKGQRDLIESEIERLQKLAHVVVEGEAKTVTEGAA